ncbi:MAG: type III-B CRISPR-associated protein Cas10/Cmr2, partial [Thermoguttaceae bacterium]|nr:type III-B CRISPR-associated protein Cas10/Cmr2 [Thermoguttaceae bacterium]
MTNRFRDILVAYLHDPPDKALDIAEHEARARRYLRAALGDDVSEAELKDLSDTLASVAERLPTPNARTLVVSPEQGRLTTFHPLSGKEEPLPVSDCREAVVRDAIEQAVRDIDDTEQRFLMLWRTLKDRLSRVARWYAHLPADTRVPDHTIWHHLDTTAALKAAKTGIGSHEAFLSFAIGPVQPFIEAARSLRDLWSGSMILAWLTFQAMLPVVERLGPTSLVYPAVRGLPWLDLWLRDKKQLSAIDAPPPERCAIPCIPNRFLALVPWGEDGREAQELALACEEKARQAWRDLAEKVRDRLHHVFEDHVEAGLRADWDRHWLHQIENYFELHTAVLPLHRATDEELAKLLAGKETFDKAFPEAGKVRKLANAIPDQECPGYVLHSRCEAGHDSDGPGPCRDCGEPSEIVGHIHNAGLWQHRLELSSRLMQARRSIRHVPPATPVAVGNEEFPPKCSLLGSYEQMGPAGLDDSRKFWDEVRKKCKLEGVRLRERERFCAVALVKRFAAPAFLRKKLHLSKEDFRYEDTATVAAACWLEKHPDLEAYSRSQHSSQWLHWSSPRQGKEDGDDEEVPKEVWDSLLKARREEAPPTYYAVLMMDGDHMGGWLRGDNSPKVREILHPKLRDYFGRLPNAASALEAKRPVGPALHAAISEALANFALYFVPEIVERHKGRLIYAGGDDVLAILPTRTALACAKELRETFRMESKSPVDGKPELLLMGSRATVSAGLAIVHYKADLRFALRQARDAEKAAKKAGRDALQIAVCRRSGEHATAL